MSLFVLLPDLLICGTSACYPDPNCPVCYLALGQLFLDVTWCKYLQRAYKSLLFDRFLFQFLDTWPELMVGRSSPYFFGRIPDTKHFTLSCFLRNFLDASCDHSRVLVSACFLPFTRIVANLYDSLLLLQRSRWNHDTLHLLPLFGPSLLVTSQSLHP